MLKILFSSLLVLLLSCASEEEKNPHEVEIHEVNPDRQTALTKQNLIQLSQVYDLTPLLFYKKIVVQSGAKTDHGPSIILDTNYSSEPQKLLATLLHEEFRWWYSNNTKKADGAEKELRKLLKTDPKDPGHLLVSYLEFRALKYYLGEKDARKILQDFIRSRRFSNLYRKVLGNQKLIEKIMKKHDLIPAFLL